MSSFYIPKPCHENWNNMTKQEQGRHCAVCEKVVVDFSKKTHEEIIDVIDNAVEGNVCGHFSVNQLDQKAQANVFMNPRNLFNRNWKYFAMSIFGLVLFNKKSAAQTSGRVKMQGAVAYRPQTNTKQTILAGIVSDKSGKKLADTDVKITSEGRDVATVKTNADGFYSIKIAPGKIYNHKVTVVVNHNAYESKTVNDLAVTKEVVRLNVVMDEYMMIMGKVAPLTYKETEKQDNEKQLENTLNDSSINLKIEQLKKEIAEAENKQQEMIKAKADIEKEWHTVKGEVNYVPGANKPNQKCGQPVTVKTTEIAKTCILTNDNTVKTTMCEIKMNGDDKLETIISHIPSLTLADTTGGDDFKDEKQVTSTLLSPTSNQLSIYPNPARTYAIVTCIKEGAYKVEVLDEKGALQQAVSFNGIQLQLDTDALQRGVHFVRISNDTGVVETIKLVKE
jgi:hypothetical protein